MLCFFEKALFGSSLLLASVAANATFVSTDVYEVGDGLATLQAETGIEWLSLSQTKNMSLLQVSNLLDSTFKGWRLPTRAEAEYLIASQFPSYSGSIYNGDGGAWSSDDLDIYEQVSIFSEFFGYTNTSSNVTSMLGVVYNDQKDLRGGYDVLNYGYYKYIDGTSKSVVFGSQSSFTGESNAKVTFKSSNFGVYLVSDGGVTLSSINDPSLNANNSKAPGNSGPSDVPIGLSFLGLALVSAGIKRRK